MQLRGFLVACLATTLGVCALCAGTIFVLDPYFRYQPIDQAGEVWFDERYQAPGILHHQDYETLLMGTSLAANYQPSWLDAAFDTQTVKITLPNGGLNEFDTVLRYAMGEQDVQRVIFGMDANILARNPAEAPDELPEYLYNNRIWDDAPYLLNKETLSKSLYLFSSAQQAQRRPFDQAYLWEEGKYIFSKPQAIACYPRPEISGVIQPDEYYLENCQSNLAVALQWLEDYPDTEFMFYFSPYSMLFWDMMDRDGTTGAMFSMLDYALGEVLTHPNVTVQFFMNDFSLITDLESYTDHIHCSAAITQWLAKSMAGEGYTLTPENYQYMLSMFEAQLENYDFESLFEP